MEWLEAVLRWLWFNLAGYVAIVLLAFGIFWFICVKFIPWLIGLFWHGGSPRL